MFYILQITIFTQPVPTTIRNWENCLSLKTVQCTSTTEILGSNMDAWIMNDEGGSRSLTREFLVRFSKICRNLDPDLHRTTLQRKSHAFIFPEKGIAWPQSQFPHSLVCERFIYSQDRSTYFPAELTGRTWMWKLRLRPRNSFSGNIC